MIDLTPDEGRDRRPAARGARRAAAARPGRELDAATQEHGLAVPGGFDQPHRRRRAHARRRDRLARRARPGSTCDNLVARRGRDRRRRRRSRASASENPDLFWALRGGGGNFGVVTEFEFALHPVGPMVHLGLFFFGPDQGAELLRFAASSCAACPTSAARSSPG